MTTRLSPIVAAAQYPITAHADFAAWRRHTQEWVAQGAATGAQLLVFPEYGVMELLSIFPSEVQADIQQNISALQPRVEDIATVFADLAQQHACVIVAPSLPIGFEGRWVNRSHVFGRNGLSGWQDKWFMTRFEDEEWGISPGPPVLSVFEADWGSFGIQICYDVEFAIGAHQLCAAGAELIVVPSCTETIRGATRVHVGARARALENQCYAIVAQTIGEAPWSPIVDINYGYGAAYCPPDTGMPAQGIIAESVHNAPTWLAATLDLQALALVRQEGQVLNFRDAGLLEMRLRGQIIQVLRCRV